MLGGHVVRAGVNRHIIDLMERGLIDHVAMNGAVAIHDYELARIGATTESVARYIRTGRVRALDGDRGIERLGRRRPPGKGLATARTPGAGCCRAGIRIANSAFWPRLTALSIPATVHVGIGYDIVHEHPNCDGAAWGPAATSIF